MCDNILLTQVFVEIDLFFFSVGTKLKRNNCKGFKLPLNTYLSISFIKYNFKNVSLWEIFLNNYNVRLYRYLTDVREYNALAVYKILMPNLKKVWVTLL